MYIIDINSMTDRHIKLAAFNGIMDDVIRG
jgi:hypothetical protein